MIFARLQWLLALSCVAALGGCAGMPQGADSSSLPERVIVNEPGKRRADGPAEPAALSLPAFRTPLHDELPAEAIVYPDVLDRIRAGLMLPQVEHPWVQSELDWYVRNGEYMGRVFARAQRYLHHIANEVEARGMPREFALLPVVESAFNPFAYSRSHASGLWQFIAPTGDHFGMRRNYWQDQRRDVLEATRGALDYLEFLNQKFHGDWLLAIASYNYGSGNVRRAINRNAALGRPTDFFSLSLPAETRAYVPKLLALAKLIANPTAYGVEFPVVPDAPYFRVVPTEGPVDLRLMAELAGVDTEELHALNPSWNRWITDPAGPHRLLVPEVVADRFTGQLAALDLKARARLRPHPVAAGESMMSVASRYKVPESFLRAVNEMPRQEPGSGSMLLVPAGEVAQLRAGLGSDFERRVHLVASGESLWSISRRHGMTVSELARINGISTRATIRPGQRLTVSGTPPQAAASRSAAAQPAARSTRYVVRRGDTLSAIARRFEVTVRQLQAWNDMGTSTALRAGQQLRINYN